MLWHETVSDVAKHPVVGREQLVDVYIIRDRLAQGSVLEYITQLIAVDPAPPAYQTFGSSSMADGDREVADYTGLFDYRIRIRIHNESEPKVNPTHIRHA